MPRQASVSAKIENTPMSQVRKRGCAIDSLMSACIVATFNRWNDASELPRLMEKRTRREAVGGSNRATGFAERGSDPCVASVECGIGTASPIPTFPQTNGPACFIECVSLLDVLAQSGEASSGQIDFDHRETRGIQLLSQRTEPIRKQHRALRAGQRFHRAPA